MDVAGAEKLFFFLTQVNAKNHVARFFNSSKEGNFDFLEQLSINHFQFNAKKKGYKGSQP
jgi:hypothetical protein